MLLFVDSIVLVSYSIKQLSMIKTLKEASEKAGLKINFDMTELMTNLVMSDTITIDNKTIEQVEKY